MAKCRGRRPHPNVIWCHLQFLNGGASEEHMNLDVSAGAALLAGALSFISPCVLPLVPPYLCYVSGVSLEDMAERDPAAAHSHRPRVMLAALLFVLGFTTVFVLLGATASAMGQVLRENLPLLSQIAGVLIILMGLHFLEIFRIGFLSREMRYQHDGPNVSLFGAYFIGLAFAFGWTPCIGPVLAAILSVAGSQDSVYQGMSLLALYSLGLGIPFLIAAFSMDRFLGWATSIKRHMRTIERIMGLALIATGIAFLTGSMQAMAYWLLELFPSLASIG
jgi:cytochrome c-type biogenesis protein